MTSLQTYCTAIFPCDVHDKNAVKNSNGSIHLYVETWVFTGQCRDNYVVGYTRVFSCRYIILKSIIEKEIAELELPKEIICRHCPRAHSLPTSSPSGASVKVCLEHFK